MRASSTISHSFTTDANLTLNPCHDASVMKGAEIGSELGFYQGCYLVWNHMLQSEELKSKLP